MTSKPIPPPPGLPSFRHDEQAHRWLHVQRLEPGAPLRCSDSCPVMADWAVIDGETGLAAIACHEHIADALWNVWHGERRNLTDD